MKNFLQILGLFCLVGMLTVGPFLPTIFKINKAQTVMQLNEEEVSKTRIVIDEKNLPKTLFLDVSLITFNIEDTADFYPQNEAFYPMLLYAVPTPPPDFI